ncbi:receptor-type tyrosine-protein phosphatase H [Tachysurus vachellii]|uniref:receptor-type tyrosine-protein phosphatase H n=1 Tax=Tachysurus vachellii TaxID=175792 RepID=UPI00296AC8BF|nr:receptor-type tyrosine-protein phosphatase H [Tachysurus vachellii]
MRRILVLLSLCRFVWGISTSFPTTVATATTPPFLSNVESVSIINRTERTLTMQWNKVDNKNYNYTLIYDSQNISINGSVDGSVVTYTVKNLTAGTNYKFTLYTKTQVAQSTGYNFTSVTSPNNVNKISVKNRNKTELILEWDKVNNNSNYNYTLCYNNQNVSINGLGEGSAVTYTVQNLNAGTKYTFILYTVFTDVQSTGKSLTTVTTPSQVAKISVKNRSETELILEWDKVNNSSNYTYTLCYNNQNVSINGSEGGSAVTYTVPDLTNGTEYTFILYTVYEGVQSTGYTFKSVTTPRQVANISVKNRYETELKLEWKKVNNNSNYTYTLCYNGQNVSINGSGEGSAVTYTVQNLNAGTNYTFILYTVFKDVQSTGKTLTTVTTPLSVANVYVNSCNETSLILKWDKVDNNNIYNYTLSYNSKNISLSGSEEGSVVTYTVTDLTAGTAYIFTLYTVFDGVESRGYNITSHTIPNRVTGLHCQYSSGGYGLTLAWDPPNGGRTAVQVNMSSTSFSHTGERLKIDGLLPAQWYTFTVSAFSGSIQSVPVSITCQTDPRGVIAGVLTSLLLVILILCIGIFIWHHKSKTSSKSKISSNKYKPIPLKNFPGHFSAMSCDENRGFIEEYEDLSTVGTDQSCKIATLPENKDKNRFSNVQAYDSSRVKLAEPPGSDSDYINANYIHGYGKKKKQYIAAQGPLPFTVNDFWRMVWEQKSSAIVMLTNCTEGGKTKCEHYWPMDNMPCLYGNLLVTIQSEQKESCWTQREFIIRNESTSEEQAVTHFHFTAWPDHGVPNRTEELIQFRWIVRKHIETFPFSGPTVVHCSAGVGRTGTLIALDLLLQQMEKEELVNIADCVRGMRVSRPLMVQTQSQYVFLHQCIMESLQPKEESIPEPIYENSEMIISNALALQEYKASNKRV